MSHFCPIILKDKSMCRRLLIEDFNTVYTLETILQQLEPEMQPFLNRKKSEETAQVIPSGLLPTLLITLFTIPIVSVLKCKKKSTDSLPPKKRVRIPFCWIYAMNDVMNNIKFILGQKMLAMRAGGSSKCFYGKQQNFTIKLKLGC